MAEITWNEKGKENFKVSENGKRKESDFWEVLWS